MDYSRRQLAIATAVITELGNEIMCARCGTTVSTYHEKCNARIDERCAGFDRYDKVRMKHERLIK